MSERTLPELSRVLVEWEESIRDHVRYGTTESQAQWARNYARLLIVALDEARENHARELRRAQQYHQQLGAAQTYIDELRAKARDITCPWCGSVRFNDEEGATT